MARPQNRRFIIFPAANSSNCRQLLTERAVEYVGEGGGKGEQLGTCAKLA